MSNELQCSQEFERRMRYIRDVLYGAIQDTTTHQHENACLGTKKACEEISGLLNELSINLKKPG